MGAKKKPIRNKSGFSPVVSPLHQREFISEKVLLTNPKHPRPCTHPNEFKSFGTMNDYLDLNSDTSEGQRAVIDPIGAETQEYYAMNQVVHKTPDTINQVMHKIPDL